MMDLSGCLHVRSTRLQIAHHMALLGKAECGITEDRITENPYRFTKIYPIKREDNDKFHFYTGLVSSLMHIKTECYWLCFTHILLK
jgi:hypothetical protein